MRNHIETEPSMKKLIFIIALIGLACKANLDERFTIENEKLKSEFKIEFEKLVKKNSSKLSDEEMVKSMDSLTEQYTIVKNKALAVKYIKSKKGIERLNFLKDKFSKEELKLLINKIPGSMKKDTNYVSLGNYIRE